MGRDITTEKYRSNSTARASSKPVPLRSTHSAAATNTDLSVQLIPFESTPINGNLYLLQIRGIN